MAIDYGNTVVVDNGELTVEASVDSAETLMSLQIDETVGTFNANYSGTTDHAQLSNRDANDQHPISAITDLSDTLLAKLEASDIEESTINGNIKVSGEEIKVYRLPDDVWTDWFSILHDGTKASYDRLMKKWFIDNGVNISTTAGITALLDKWYTITRTGWNGYTSFPQPDVSTKSTGTRGGDNAGLSCTPSTNLVAGQDDYAGLPQFACTDCNWELDDSGDILVSAIDGITSNFERYNEDKYVGVLQMSMLHYWYEDETNYTHGVTDNLEDTSYENSTPYPESIKLDGTVRPWVCHGKYMAGSRTSGGMTCCSGVYIKPFISHDNLITLSNGNGSIYSGSTTLDWSFLVLMTYIKYASLTLDNIIDGCLNYNLQYYAKVSETDVKRIILTTANAANLIVGSTVIVGNYNGSSADRGTAANYSITGNTGAKITAIESIEINGTAYSAVYVDTNNTFNTTANGNAASGTTIVSTFHWMSGNCDNILGNDGSPGSLTSGKYPAKLQGIEFENGGYEILADAILSLDGTNYNLYTARLKSYQASSITANMTLSSLTSPQSNSTSWTYISKLSYDGTCFFANLTSATSSQRYKDGFYKNAKNTTGMRVWRAFGNLSTGVTAGGLSCLAGDIALSTSDWRYLARLSPNGNRGELAA